MDVRKTSPWVKIISFNAEHPHRCGEDVMLLTKQGCEGPPPRIRGLPRAKRQRSQHQGTTPTGMGKICYHGKGKYDRRDYPHLRGKTVKGNVVT